MYHDTPSCYRKFNWTPKECPYQPNCQVKVFKKRDWLIDQIMHVPREYQKHRAGKDKTSRNIDENLRKFKWPGFVNILFWQSARSRWLNMSLIPLVLRFLSRSIATVWDEKTKILLSCAPEKKLIRIKNNNKNSLTEHLFFRCLQHCRKNCWEKNVCCYKRGKGRNKTAILS